MVELVIRSGWRLRRTAAAWQVDPKTVARWVVPYKAEGQTVFKIVPAVLIFALIARSGP